jgi:hypothetical protein
MRAGKQKDAGLAALRPWLSPDVRSVKRWRARWDCGLFHRSRATVRGENIPMMYTIYIITGIVFHTMGISYYVILWIRSRKIAK